MTKKNMYSFIPRVVVAPGAFAHRSPYNILSAKWQYCGPCKADNNPRTTAIFIKELNFLRAIRIQWVKCSWTRFWIRRSYLRSSSLAVFFLWRSFVFSPANIRNAASCDSSQSRLKVSIHSKVYGKRECVVPQMAGEQCARIALRGLRPAHKPLVRLHFLPTSILPSPLQIVKVSTPPAGYTNDEFMPV